tara:strand:- start:646 stop:3159 length:2514 start_codon:yes stop_codon:yes gene_type:complete
MSKTVDQLVVEIRAETKKLRKGLDGVNKKLDQSKQKTDKVNKALKAMGGIIAGIGLGKLISSSVQTIRTFEDLEATLRAITGSAKAAGISFDVIREFTKGTTFQIDEVADAFINLLRAGVKPTSDVLKDFGNLAAGSGKSIQQLSQAAFNATTGEMEMLKQFGIIAKLEGDKINVSFQGIGKTIKRDGDSIIEYLRSIGREKFSTAIEERLDTLSGAISNLGDASSEFQVSIGEGGLKSSLTNLAKEFTKVLSEATPLAEMLGATLGGALTILGNIILTILENIKFLTSALLGLTAAGLVTGVGRLSKAFAFLNKTLKASFVTSAALMALTGPKGWAAIATAVGVATASYIALDIATQGSNDAGKDKDKLDKQLEENVIIQKDNIKLLVQENERLVNSFKSIDRSATLSLGNIIDQGGGIEGVKNRIEDLYNTYREKELEAQREIAAQNPKSMFSVTGFLSTEDLEIDRFREEFYTKMFGMSGEELSRILDISLIAPVDDAMKQVMDAINIDVDPIQALRDVFADEAALQGLFEEAVALKNYTGSIDDFKKSIQDFITLTDTKLDGAQEAIFNIFNAGARDDIDLATAAIAANENALQEVFDTLLIVDAAFAQSGITFLEFSEQYKRGVASMNEDTEEIKSTFMDTLAPAIQSASLSFTTTLADAMLQGELSLTHFRDFSKNIVSQIIAIFLQMMVVNKILKSIFGSGGLGIEGFDDLQTFSIGDGPLGRRADSIAQGMAGGGAIQGGRATLVGERGPEIFVPNTGGKIMNNMNSKNAMGGGGTTVINQSINFATGIIPTVRAEVMQMMPQIADVTKAAVQESAMRGGTFRRSLAGG